MARLEAELVLGDDRNSGQALGGFDECTFAEGVIDSPTYTDTAAGSDEPPVYIGFDTEWARDPKSSLTNNILAYGLMVVCGEGRYPLYREPTDSKKRRDRLPFKRLLGDALRGARDAGVIRCWPKEVVVAMHYGRGDLAACWDFKMLKPQMVALKGTVASGGAAVGLDVELHEKSGLPVDSLPLVPGSQQVNATDASGNLHRVNVRFVDTFNLTPADGGSLEKLGDLIGFPKVELPEGYSPADMRRFMAERPEDFRAYLMRDALITALYARRWALFCSGTLGLKGVPSTLGGAAVRYLQMLWKRDELDRRKMLGLEGHTSRRYSEATQRINVVRGEDLSFVRALTELAATQAYRGGWTETYLTGPILAGPGADLRDIDLKSAYPSAMAALGILDLSTFRAVGQEQIEDFTATAMGVAEIEFETPAGIRFPGLGVPTEAGLIFPRRGRTVATSPEIAAARALGVSITILNGFLVDWDREARPFLDFVVALTNLRQRLKTEGRDTFESLMVKTIANSLYGKLGQGVHARAAYDIRSGRSKKLRPSPVTQPLLAAYTTGVVRASIFEMLNSLPETTRVVSVSTDGFLTDARVDDICIAHPATQTLLEARKRIAEATGAQFVNGASDLLEVKKTVIEVVAFRNRGIATTLTAGDSKPVLAKAGNKVPKGVDANAFMLHLYLGRDYGTRMARSDLISLRDQMEKNADLVSIARKPTVSLEPDLKRRIVAGWDATIAHGEHAGVTHLATSSEPYDTVDEALQTKAFFRQWRDRTRRCLKSVDDWRCWQDHLAASNARGRGRGGVHVTAGGSADVAKRQFLRALVRDDWALSRGGRTFEEVAATLSDCGYPTTVGELKNASRAGCVPQEARCADTPDVQAFLSAIAPAFPGFEANRLFPAGGEPAAGGAL